ncbi:hypothetical protein K458DRAFT_381975 [Lentithecium fluviatile CBS 122367]|uniref:Type 1 phosphatases regulator n=1 Tax=Lentithecium fluviatile CBS 122367 TaxID=1168545 RepID=A0A6G1JPR4_9PLEO|nr:hypothetical protein K458DRAFT_381975 [Lentithecium fluviatile CBS 122367]
MSNSNENMAARTSTPVPSSNTVTQTITPHPVLRFSATSGTLRLRAEPTEQRHIQWAEDVVDNEGMGRKSSKVCCIYHKPREVGESSDESSSDSSSDSDSDSEPDNSTARAAGGNKRGGRRGRRPHDHDHKDGDGCGDGSGNGAPKKGHPRRKPSPNAYEKVPKQRK